MMTSFEQIERCKKIIDKYEYISFDIFDTLIKRNVSKPSDVFLLVQKKYEKEVKIKLNNWKEIRIKAEREARNKSNGEEITIDEIYQNISMDMYNKIDIERLKYIEINIEIEICNINKQIYEIYKYCKEKKKKILITSDMYLPREVIEKILKNNKFEYDKLFLSSELKKKKSDGSLYKYILEFLNIGKEQIVHFGDNKKSDFIRAKQVGIKSVLIKEIKQIQYQNNKDVKKVDQFNYECLKLFINNNIDSNKEYYWKTGYETLGPLLYAYVYWLNKKFEQKKYDNIFFLSRDGLIMQKAYNIMYPNNNSKYMYASRRALIVPSLWMYKDLKEISEIMNIPEKVTARDLIKKLGLEPEEYIKIIKKYNYELDSIVSRKNVQEKDVKFYNDIKEDIYKNSKGEYENLLKYLKTINFEKKVAIIDIGWYGNMQNAIEKISKSINLDVTVDGYYLGIMPHSDKQLKYSMEGFLFDKNREELFHKKRFFNAIFELIFSADHGSVKRYTNNKELVELCPYEYKDTDTDINIRKFQEGALQFIKDYKNSGISNFIEFNENISMYNLLEFGNRPKKIDIKKFGNIQFYDDIFYEINKVRPIRYYIFHLRKLKKDIQSSMWKPAFLKNILKINLPYYEILLKLRGVIKDKL